jgi:DNA polymerase-3 subunit alpha
MALFGEDYLKNKHFLAMGNFIYLTGRVEERYNQKGLWEFRPKVFHLLSEIRKDLSKEIELQIDLNELNGIVVNDLERTAKVYHGNCRIKLVVYDSEEKIKVDLLAKKYLVDPINEFFEEIKKLEGIDYRIISKGVELGLDQKPAYKHYSNVP